MKKTALHNKHIELGAKMVPFAGFHMPIQYSGVNQEHNNVRNNVGVFDVSHMGEFLITGEHALELIQKISSNDASKLFPGRAQYSYLPNAKGGIVDDMLVYMLDYHRYMLVVNGSNIEKDWDQERAKKVISFVKSFLDENFPLTESSWTEISKIQISEEKIILFNGSKKVSLKNNDQFIGYNGNKDNPYSIIIKNNGLHIDIVIDASTEVGKIDFFMKLTLLFFIKE